jgi:hypothetical protein
MKFAYLSFISLWSEVENEGDINKVDEMLKSLSAEHEILFIRKQSERIVDESKFNFYGPITIIDVSEIATRDEMTLCGFGRAVGDFIIEWQAPLNKVSPENLQVLLDGTNQGYEIVELSAVDQSRISKMFYSFVNLFRPANKKVAQTIGLIFSRFALSKLIAHADFDVQLKNVVADLPLSRKVVKSLDRFELDRAFSMRIRSGFVLLSKGGKFGSTIPLAFACFSALIGLFTVVYSLVVYFAKNKSPEGWTTLMIIFGLNFSVIMLVLSLLWSRLEAIARSLSKDLDITSSISVTPPKK